MALSLRPAVFILWSALLVWPVSPAAAKFVYLFPKASTFVPEGKEAERLIEELKSNIEEEPYNYEHYSMLVFAYEYIGDYEKELEALKLQVKYLPDGYEDKDKTYGNLARAYFLNGFWKEGKEWLDKADAINERNFHNRWNAFRYYYEFKNDYDAAARELERLESLTGGNTDVYYDAYVEILEKHTEHNNALLLFQAAVKQSPNNHKAHRALGMAVRTASWGQYEESIPNMMEHFNRALELGKEYVPTYISIADTYLVLARISRKDEHFDLALDWFNKAYTIEPTNARLNYAMGQLFLYMGENDKAIKKYEFAFSQGLDDEPLLQGLANAYNQKAYNIYLSGENLDLGIEVIDKAIEMRPEDGVILSTKAELLYKLGKYEEAYDYIQRGIALEPEIEEIQKDFQMIEEALGL